ncbi:hypothetical protein [Ammoniphilus resinae]|uniref:Uncharacterized protein n=1 Tax=Ammoniphilus resinae TaxID=861532 RepID=A0ABS4GRR0_9BACL|nr:hypothetical protein [Ammoniphilus resinae]MBP1932958.1 hypothetical protein [Ammoniphilus resinae]
MKNSYEFYAVIRLVERYDYDGAVEVLELLSLQDHPIYYLVSSCHRSLNFNFYGAKELLQEIKTPFSHQYTGITRYIQEIPPLIKGNPGYIFNELFDNIVIQLERDEYTEFLGRIFQLRELLLKYAVIQFKERKDYTLRDRIYQKKAFLTHFKIRHGLMNGMKEILRTGGGRWQKIINILTGKPMNELMDLRHQTIVAHGIETATLKDISRIYQSPEHILNDLREVFQYLNIYIRPHKYTELNQNIIEILSSDLHVKEDLQD